MSALLSGLSFVTPLALWGLLALPVIWWLLRFVPPRPRPVTFPPIRILLGLDPKLETPDKTPWWLLFLRLALAALLILGVAHPEWIERRAGDGMGGHTLVVVDDGWGSAADWTRRRDLLNDLLGDARRENGRVTVTTTAKTTAARRVQTVAAADALAQVQALQPQALPVERQGFLQQLTAAKIEAPDRIIWVADGFVADGFADGLVAAFPKAAVTVITPDAKELPLSLSRPERSGADLSISVQRADAAVESTPLLQARAANGRVLAEQKAVFAAGGTSAKVSFSLPTELRNEVQSIVIAGADHAGARQLLDDQWRRKTIALQVGTSIENEQPLLSPLHYISRALEQNAELFEPKTAQDLTAQLDSGVSMVILADIGIVADAVKPRLEEWIDKGGVLLRFAGPRLAASSDDLVPVILRQGGRELGSALSWEKPQSLQAFPASSPFQGLSLDERAMVSQQVLAEPDADLADRTWASLSDGTPLVTAQRRGKGMIVLFHVTASPDWSTLPLTGLFVDMLKRIVDLAPAAGSAAAANALNTGEAAAYAPRLIMSGRGELLSPTGDIVPIPAENFDAAVASLQSPPGLYARGGMERAINLVVAQTDMKPLAPLAASVSRRDFTPPVRVSYAPLLFLLAMALFIADCLAALMMGGGLARLRPAAAVTVMVGALFVVGASQDPAQAQSTDDIAMQATLQTRLAFVKTGNGEIDDVSDAGLKGLGFVINDRTSIALADPIGVDLERDEIVFYPLLYWAVDADAGELSSVAATKIDDYMKRGGTVFFDLRDDGLGSGSLSDGLSPTGEALKRILNKLDVPPLETVAGQHVLTRSFYLLDAFPGRFSGPSLWVESGHSGAASDPRTADGVSSIIIGYNDYAAAWAYDERGEPMFAMTTGDERQREFAYRTGVNIVMYALTGNYKADQVHVPALLERLGQ